jgi:hypothetical protein
MAGATDGGSRAQERKEGRRKWRQQGGRCDRRRVKCTKTTQDRHGGAWDIGCAGRAKTRGPQEQHGT